MSMFRDKVYIIYLPNLPNLPNLPVHLHISTPKWNYRLCDARCEAQGFLGGWPQLKNHSAGASPQQVAAPRYQLVYNVYKPKPVGPSYKPTELSRSL